MPERTDGPLSDDEYQVFLELLRRFCVHELDQWELWRLGTPHGEVYITITRKPAPGMSPEAYNKLPFPEGTSDLGAAD